MPKSPIITVITVSFNAVSSIEETILSVINQTYSNIEYIVIDGGSIDGTVDIIQKYEDRIAYWVSEPDKGIYDAMNKGIDAATGEWVNFMNSGDTFYSETTVEHIVRNIKDNIDVLYGDTILKYSFGLKEKKALPLNTMMKHIPFTHQSCSVRLSLMREKFDLRYSICGDYHFFYRQYIREKSFQYIPLFISVYEASEGYSSTNALALQKEVAQINGSAQSYFYDIKHVGFSLYCMLSHALKSLLPKQWIIFIQKLKT